jgi:hypothetical protein
LRRLGLSRGLDIPKEFSEKVWMCVFITEIGRDDCSGALWAALRVEALTSA